MYAVVSPLFFVPRHRRLREGKRAMGTRMLDTHQWRQKFLYLLQLIIYLKWREIKTTWIISYCSNYLILEVKSQLIECVWVYSVCYFVDSVPTQVMVVIVCQRAKWTSSNEWNGKSWSRSLHFHVTFTKHKQSHKCMSKYGRELSCTRNIIIYFTWLVIVWHYTTSYI